MCAAKEGQGITTEGWEGEQRLKEPNKPLEICQQARQGVLWHTGWGEEEAQFFTDLAYFPSSSLIPRRGGLAFFPMSVSSPALSKLNLHYFDTGIMLGTVALCVPNRAHALPTDPHTESPDSLQRHGSSNNKITK